MAETSGLADLLPYLGDRPTLAFLAVKAPIGQVTGALVDRHGPRVIENAPVRPGEGDPAPESCAWMAVVRARDESWTLVYRTFEPIEDRAWLGLEEAGVDLVRTLGTRAVLVGLGGAGGTDRALVLSAEGPVDLDLDDATTNQFVEERATWSGGVIESFESALRAEPFAEGDPVPEDFVERLLCDRGIWVPPCWPRAKGDEAFLVVAEIDPGRIERVDLLDLATRSAFDEETLELRRSEIEDDLRSARGEAAPEPGSDPGSIDAAGNETESEPEPRSDARAAESSAETPTEPAVVEEPGAPPSRLEGFLNRLFGRGER